MCWFLRTRLASQKKAAEQKVQNVKNSMAQSINRLSSSMSGVWGAPGSSSKGPGTKETGKGAGKGSGKRAGKDSPGVNTPNKKGKREKQKQKKAGKTSFAFLTEPTSTLPSLCKFFKKPQKQQGSSLPSKEFRHYMSQSWEGEVVQLVALHDIEEEDEEDEENY